MVEMMVQKHPKLSAAVPFALRGEGSLSQGLLLNGCFNFYFSPQMWFVFFFY